MTAPDPAWVEAGAKALADEGGLPGSSIHSWRCEYPDRYGPCDCVPQTVVEILAAVVPLIREQIAADIEAVRASHLNCPHPECAQAYGDAARIARGGAR